MLSFVVLVLWHLQSAPHHLKALTHEQDELQLLRLGCLLAPATAGL